MDRGLAEQSRLLDLIFEHTLDNIVLLDKDYNFVRVSDSYARACQVDAADLIGRNHFDVFPSALEQELVPFRQAKQTYRRTERPFIFPDHPEWGTTFWDLAMVPILDAAGEIEFHLFTLKDVTDRKRADQRTAESEERFRALFEQAAVGVAEIDTATGRFIQVNPKYCGIVGYSGEEMLALDFMRITHPDDLVPDLDGMERLKRGELREFSMEKRLFRKDGSTVWVQLTVSPLWAAGDTPTRHIAVVQDVSDHKRAELALAKREEFLELSQEVGHVGSWDWDVAGNTIQWSGEMCRLHGQDPGSYVPTLESALAFYHPDDAAHFPVQVEAMLQGRGAPSNEYRVVRPDGTIRTHLVSQRTYVDASGTTVRIVGTNLDITAQRQSEDALRASEERFKSLFENAIVGIYRTTSDGRILAVNQALVDLLGYASVDELMQRNLEQSGFDPGYSRAQFKEDLERQGYVTGLEAAWTRTDGSTVFVRESARHVRDEHGSSLYFEGTVEDITDRKRIEEQFRNSEAQYRRIVETAVEGIWTLDAAGLTTFVNEAMAAMLGYRPDEMLRVSFLDFMDEPARVEAGKAFERRLALESEQLDFRFRHRSGRDVWTRLSTGPIADDAGRFAGALAMVTDITAQKYLESQMLQSQKMESVGMLAGGIAHDFNNLLTIINGAAELAEIKLQNGALADRELVAIRGAGAKAAVLVRQLLAFSRKQILQSTTVNLNTLVVETGAMLRRVIGEQITLSFDLGEHLWAVTVDPGQFEQVILNLAINSRDAMPDGGRLHIQTQNVRLDAAYAQTHPAVRLGDYVRLALTDTGVGMDDATRQRVFEPFFSTKGPGKGTGLGLSMAYGIVTQSRGRIEVSSEAGQGTTVTIYLPRAEGEVPALQIASPEAVVVGGTETILVVEDEAEVREVARDILASVGYTVRLAANGQAALSLLASQPGPIHLVLTDIVMPEMGGRALAEHLKVRHPDVKILFTSGHTDDALVHDEVGGKRMFFIGKPYTVAGLAYKVRMVLDS